MRMLSYPFLKVFFAFDKFFLETEIKPVFRNRNLRETVNHYETEIKKFYETVNRKPKPVTFIRFALNPWLRI